MRDVILLCPQSRDLAGVAAAGLDERFRVHPVGPDLDTVERIDPEAILAEAEGVPADGVVATKDRSALLAALLAERRGLPGPTPQALLACQHKPTSRRIHERVAPEATPRWAVLGSEPPPFGPPWFVKPVVGQALPGREAGRRPVTARRPRRCRLGRLPRRLRGRGRARRASSRRPCAATSPRSSATGTR